MTGYDRPVRTALARLVLLIAMLLMPLGMNPIAAASTAPGPAMSMSHCPDSGSSHHAKGGLAECTMACAGALPATDQAQRSPRLAAREPIRPAAVRQLGDLHPETATPPPRLS